MKSISIGEIRQNPTRMLRDVESGETYSLTRHHREVARIIPADGAVPIPPPRRSGRADVRSLPRVKLPEGMSMDDLLDDMKGDW